MCYLTLNKQVYQTNYIPGETNDINGDGKYKNYTKEELNGTAVNLEKCKSRSCFLLIILIILCIIF